MVSLFWHVIESVYPSTKTNTYYGASSLAVKELVLVREIKSDKKKKRKKERWVTDAKKELWYVFEMFSFSLCSLYNRYRKEKQRKSELSESVTIPILDRNSTNLLLLLPG